MIRSFRKMAVAVAAIGAVTGAFAAQTTVQFKTFYDTSTLFNTKDTATVANIATLKLVDNAGGGVTGTLTFNDTNFPNSKAGLSVSQLWLASSIKGTVKATSGTSLTASYYSRGFTQEGEKFNYDINYKANSFKEGQTSQFTITGATVASIASRLTMDPKTSDGVMLEVSGVGGKYSGLLGLNKSVHFIGTVVPEPSTYALMALGLVGIAAVARKRQAA